MRKLKLFANDSFHQEVPEVPLNLDDYSMEDPVQRVTYLYRVVSNSGNFESINQGLKMLLAAGLKKIGADLAIVSRPLSTQVYDVVASAGADEEFFVGKHLSLNGTLCEEVITKNATCSHGKVQDKDVHSLSMAYNNTRVGAYLGTVVRSRNAGNSVMSFISSRSREQDYSTEDVAFIELLEEGVACMTDQQLAQAQRKLTDQAMFALGSVKTLDEYLEQARLPEVFGVPARVVEVLQRRIGHAPLSIGHVAEELNLSKRTLQRRLQQMDVSFADLRDQVRFHHSIDYLIKQHLSIDSISASLDFSDRTSFTNAFKRWTGLSPSTFRKLFRDYV
ncbi:AraC family transcriptional regulator [Teredinibacter turnerae]|uniref:helix-turn-helix domain-containing protein n=1 Tax=Teredinibacter turnerae TaxID=2426 RepID=UPI0005683B3C|nr:AraC family transcriptional regulator [Teredinibacter turnerae]